MNIFNNNRRRTSQEKIEKAFIEFLEEKQINEIKVTDIVKKANINRSTFYSNYIDIYDLADKIKDRLEHEVNDVTNSFEKCDFLKLFKHIKDNQKLYKTYFKLGYDKNIVLSNYNIDNTTNLDNKYIDYHIEFFKAGLNALIKKWLDNGCLEEPDEMYNILISEYKK